MKDKIKDKAIHWVACKKEGLTFEQEKEFESWLKEDEEHQKAFEEANLVYSIFQNIPKNHTQTLSKNALKEAKKIKFIEKTVKPFIGMAAILCGLFIGYKFFIPEYEKDYKTQFSSLKQEILPDGSKLSIDTKSNLQIEYFKDKRKVFLENGQVLFEVAKDKSRAFIITSGKTSIEVVGTKFEVKNLEHITTVSVEEGVVKVSFNNHTLLPNQDISLLKKGEKIVISDLGKITYLGKTDIEEIAPWRNDELIFRKITLKEAFDTFSRYQDLKVEFQNKNFENKLFSGKFNTLEIDKFLFAIQKIYPIKIVKSENKITVN
ncbi:FecR family protein [Aliarcobacter butzleri]|uniref:FecR family protein n=1 Tax=Aliarcobacter butzleri TaxID=28197 RepID=UPI00263ED0AF|nr:FecR domain-containing protein [Aliarcobacter butzleri]MDN5095502.1 FecR domain-containing protein [Aliarcobacter butzleri]